MTGVTMRSVHGGTLDHATSHQCLSSSNQGNRYSHYYGFPPILRQCDQPVMKPYPTRNKNAFNDDHHSSSKSLHFSTFGLEDAPQLLDDGHVVAAFEQSLSNMTSRLQHLTATAEQKDSELNELRNTIEMLRTKSAEASLMIRASEASQMSSSPHIARRHTFNDSDKGGSVAIRDGSGGKMSRHMSTDSVSSLSSACSFNSNTSRQSVSTTASSFGDMSSAAKKKKKGWLRSSFSKAFSRSKKNRNGSVSDVEDIAAFQSDTSAPNSPLMMPVHQVNASHLLQNIKNSQSSSAIYEKDDDIAPEAVVELKKQLREKDMVLTDIRLEALTSAHQLESMKETVNKMRSQMISLKQDNDRLQRMVTSKSLASSQNSLQTSTNRNSLESLDKKLSTSEHSGPSSIDMLLAESQVDSRDGKRVLISVFQGCHGDYSKFCNQEDTEVLIGSVFVSSKTKWDLLDNIVRRAFKEYVLRVDPASNLGLNAESVDSYHIGDICRTKDSEPSELLPCGYLVGNNNCIKIILRGTLQSSVDALAFDSFIPKSIIQRYVSLLTEHRRIILCGPSGTGKTYLAHKLGEFLVLRSGKELSGGSVATFSVDHKSAKELRQYLSNVAEQCENNAADLPSVIILDNLHHVGSLADVFNGFLNTKYLKCPYIIGTMNQATCSTTNLQLHHNFRWVLCANHMEPVKGFLGRYLRKKLVEHEAKVGSRNCDLNKVIDWMPRVWEHLNKFLETHSSSDVTIGPRLFLSCPVDMNSSQVWFTDLWNYSIVPYLLEAVREGLQLYGRRAAWEDPAAWVLDSYPWPNPPEDNSDWPPQLLRLRPEDVGYDGINIQNGPGTSAVRNGVGKASSSGNQSDTDADPLLNMLMRLQEAASYTSPHSSLNRENEHEAKSLCSSQDHKQQRRPSNASTDSSHSGIESTL